MKRSLDTIAGTFFWGGAIEESVTFGREIVRRSHPAVGVQHFLRSF